MAELTNEAQIEVTSNRGSRIPAPTLEQLWLGLPVFMLTLKAFLFPLPLLDFWWHLRMGQIILETRTIPHVDVFSFTATGQPFVVQNWLAEIVFFLTYLAGGFAGLIFLNAVLVVATLIPVYYLCRKASAWLWPGVFSSCLVAVCIICNLRPQVFSFLLFALFYWLLTDYCSERADRIWLLPILMVLWVNLHGAFILGLALMGIFLVCETIRSYSRSPQQEALTAIKLRKLALVLVFCSIATIANPEMFKVYSYVHTVMQDPSSQEFVVEWQPPTISSVQGVFLFYLPFFLTTLVLVSSGRRPNLTDTMLYVAFSILGMTATRNATWFLLVSAPILARYLPLVQWTSISLLRGRVQGPKDTSTPFQRRLGQTRQFRTLNLAIAGAALILLSVQSPWVQSGLYRSSLLDAKTPVAAMDYIKKHPLEGNIFHPQIYGDYLIWRLWPGEHSFLDGRVHLFGAELVKDYQQIYRDSHWEDLLAKYEIRYMLLCKQEDLQNSDKIIVSARGSRNWTILYEDDQSILFESKTPRRE